MKTTLLKLWHDLLAEPLWLQVLLLTLVVSLAGFAISLVVLASRLP